MFVCYFEWTELFHFLPIFIILDLLFFLLHDFKIMIKLDMSIVIKILLLILLLSSWLRLVLIASNE